MSLEGCPSQAEIGVMSLTIEAFDDPDDFGRFDNRTDRLLICPNMKPGQTVDTLLHEILHAIGEAYGIPQLRGNSKRTEDLIRQLAPALMMFKRDNPALDMWLLKEAVRSRGV